MKLFFYLLILNFFSCTMNNSSKDENVHIDLSKSFIDTLRADIKTSPITGMELNITGMINGKGKIYYSHAPFQRKQLLEFEREIDTTILSDWYDERVLIQYDPENNQIVGSIIVNFKVK